MRVPSNVVLSNLKVLSLKVNAIAFTPKKSLKDQNKRKLSEKILTKIFSLRWLQFWEHCWKLLIKLRKTVARCQKRLCTQKYTNYFQIVSLDKWNAVFRTLSKNVCWGSKSLSLKVRRNILYWKPFPNTSLKVILWSGRSQFWGSCQNVYRRIPKIFAQSPKTSARSPKKIQCFSKKVPKYSLRTQIVVLRTLLKNILSNCQTSQLKVKRKVFWIISLPKCSSAQVECSYENGDEIFQLKAFLYCPQIPNNISQKKNKESSQIKKHVANIFPWLLLWTFRMQLK